MKGFCPLASGSKGNCIYFGSDNTKILIDAGLSLKATKLKLQEINVSIEEIDAILVTHEHGDHIQGLRVLSNSLQIPVLANHETAKGIVEALHDCPKFKIFSTGESFEFGDLEIHPFSIPHDTLDPVAFTIKTEDKKIGFCADLGFVTTGVIHQLQACDYLYLEANHEPSMVHASARPQVYKQRVLGRSGHLSNEETGKLLSLIAHSKLKHVHLAHLSSECNTHETALSRVGGVLEASGIHLEMSIAYQEKVSRSIIW